MILNMAVCKTGSLSPTEEPVLLRQNEPKVIGHEISTSPPPPPPPFEVSLHANCFALVN